MSYYYYGREDGRSKTEHHTLTKNQATHGVRTVSELHPRFYRFKVGKLL